MADEAAETAPVMTTEIVVAMKVINSSGAAAAVAVAATITAVG
jgi:hypothetical protein